MEAVRHNRAWDGNSRICVWYDTGEFRVIQNTREEWDRLPSQGVMIVKGPTSSPEHRLHRSMDYYWWEDSKVMSCRRVDLDRYLERSVGVCSCKFGRWGKTEVFSQALKQALDWVG